MGTGSRTVAYAQRQIDAFRLQTAAINARLGQWGFAHLQLDLSRNITLRSSEFVVSLFQERSRRELLGEFRTLIVAMGNHDLYDRRGQIVRGTVYGLAILIPLSARAWWLTQTFGRTRFKHRVYKVMQALKRPVIGDGGAFHS
jgi:hypothetical protein